MSSDRIFISRLLLDNALVIAVLVALALIYVSPNCPGALCDWQVNQFSLGAALIVVSGNLTAISLYFVIRFLRK